MKNLTELYLYTLEVFTFASMSVPGTWLTLDKCLLDKEKLTRYKRYEMKVFITSSA